MVKKDTPEIISYRQDDIEKTMKRVEDKLDRVIENYATKVELAQAINERDERLNTMKEFVSSRIDDIEKEILVITKRKTTSLTISMTISIITGLTAAVALYEVFR